MIRACWSTVPSRAAQSSAVSVEAAPNPPYRFAYGRHFVARQQATLQTPVALHSA